MPPNKALQLTANSAFQLWFGSLLASTLGARAASEALLAAAERRSVGQRREGLAMVRWNEFAEQAPEIAEAGRALLYQFGPGLGYLATVRPDGAPRIHPVCVNIVEGGLYTLVVPSPKRQDLQRDGRFALHSFSSPTVDDEFFLAGRVVHHVSPALVAKVRDAQQASGATTSDTEELFEYQLDRALYSRYKPRGEPDNWPPEYLRWRP